MSAWINWEAEAMQREAEPEWLAEAEAEAEAEWLAEREEILAELAEEEIRQQELAMQRMRAWIAGEWGR